MTQDEIIEMAMQAEFILHGKPSDEESELFVCLDKDIVRFAKLVATKEREACAKVCEDMTLEWEDQPHIARVELATMMDCALAIRARGET